MMYYEEYGNKENPTIVFLHGANVVKSFFKQYCLKEKYHIIVPHITGYGMEYKTDYTTDKALKDIVELISSLNEKVTLIGFSLGAQLGFVLVSKYPDLFNKAILVSPWIIKEPVFLEKIKKYNAKAFKLLKHTWFCKFQGKAMGFTKELCLELANDCKNTSLTTIMNSVDNKISFEMCPEFKDANLPIYAICGAKEYDEVSESVKKMAELNPNCTYEIVKKASHNIPTNFSDLLLNKINEYMSIN